MPQNIITNLDVNAMRVGEQEPDQNLYEFDLTLWSLLSTLACSSPNLTKQQFDLTDCAIEALQNIDEDSLKRLSSGVLISFKLRTNEAEILAALEKSYSPTINWHHMQQAAFDATYWLLMKTVALSSPSMISAAFGVSKKLAFTIASSTDNQIRQMATEVKTNFTLSFDPTLLPQLTSYKKGRGSARFFIRKYQQALSVASPLQINAS